MHMILIYPWKWGYEMIVGTVVGRLVSTRKHEKLIGSKLLICELLHGQSGKNKIVATDTIGAGIGEMVLITQGGSARMGAADTTAPVDAVIVGIIDEENDMSIYE